MANLHSVKTLASREIWKYANPRQNWALCQHYPMPSGAWTWNQTPDHWKTQVMESIQNWPNSWEYDMLRSCAQPSWIWVISGVHAETLRGLPAQGWIFLEPAARLDLCLYEDAHQGVGFLSIDLGEKSECWHRVRSDMKKSQPSMSLTHVLQKDHSHYIGGMMIAGRQHTSHRVYKNFLQKKASHRLHGLVRTQGVHNLYIETQHQGDDSESHHYIYQQGLEGKSIYYAHTYAPPSLKRIQAHQHNRNLLISERAQIMARPELDVHCHDIQCTHGSATGGLDAQALHYLHTRGLDKAQAKDLIIQGWTQSVWEGFPPNLQGFFTENVNP